MELLAPAGSPEKLRYAVWYGADAVYAACGSYSLRAADTNFTFEQLQEALDFCHAHGVKLYVAVNIYPDDRDLAALPDFFVKLAELKPDGLIIADLGVLALAKRHAPKLPIHISTQANVTNYEAAMTYYALGAKRIVLARELSLEQIRAIGARVPKDLELECFVHGAMCVSYSGRCLLSAVMTGRSANRGACAQPCRWEYALRDGEPFTAEEDARGTYILNAKDLCLIEHLRELQEAGVRSVKIEGRMKSFYYAACVTRAYRKALTDLTAGKPFDQGLLDEVRAVSHRDYTTGFLFGKPGQNLSDGGYRRTTDVVAVADDKPFWVVQKNKFQQGERLWILAPHAEPEAVTVTALWDEEGTPLESAPHAEMRVRLPFALPPHGILRRERIEDTEKE